MLEQAALAKSHVAPSAPSGVDRARLERMFAQHHEIVWRTLRRRGLNADAAADATQQTFLIALERLADIQPASERAFLVGTAIRLVRSIFRRAVRVQLETDMDLREDPRRNELDDRAAVELFDMVLSKMDGSLSEVFVLFELDGFSSPEIAGMLEIPLGTVASRLRRARDEFRAIVSRIDPTLRREAKK